MYSAIDILELPRMGFPIQKPPAQCLFSGSPKLIAAYHVFLRHPAPRHPPSALDSLAIKFSIYAFDCTISGTFEIAILYIQFSKNTLGLHPEHKAQNQKLKAQKNYLDLQL